MLIYKLLESNKYQWYSKFQLINTSASPPEWRSRVGTVHHEENIIQRDEDRVKIRL